MLKGYLWNISQVRVIEEDIEVLAEDLSTNSNNYASDMYSFEMDKIDEHEFEARSRNWYGI